MSLRKLGFKWFGSLTSLTFRRSTDKSDSKSAQPRPGAGTGLIPGDGTVSTADLSPGAETVDDMGAMRPRTASYVRSSENYTHMGTLPRLLRKKRDKNNKGGSCNKKNKDKSIKRTKSQNQEPAGDKDCALPRTTALSSLAEDEARVGADAGLEETPLTDPKIQAELLSESNAATTQNTSSVPASASEDMSSSGGSCNELQRENCADQEVIQAGAELWPDLLSQIPSLPVTPRNEKTDEEGGMGLEASRGPVEPKEQMESSEMTEGKRIQTSDSISSMEPAESQVEYVQ
ncbi:hypothetical protein LDENG_00155580 [Lucifuga dentata]|nr:hypothetical protein LDENG_00155580 [Lucifuga dentata]